MTALAARLPLRPRRTQAVPLHRLKPAPTRLRQGPRLILEVLDLLGGVMLVIAAVYIWRMIPW